MTKIPDAVAGSLSAPIPDFDSVAAAYHPLEKMAFGRAMHAARTYHLPHLSQCQSILCVGEGDGRFLADLLETNSDASIVCVETSSRMITLAQRTIEEIDRHERVRFQQCPIERFVSQRHSFDAIITNFFLDMYAGPALDPLIEKLSGFAAPGACWLVNDFTVPRSGWPRARAMILLKIMYVFFKYTAHLTTQTLESPGPRLIQNGWRPQSEKRFNRDFIASCLWKK